MPRQAAPLTAPPSERGEMAEVVKADADAEDQEERWARLLPELLSDVVRRVEASGGERWPGRKDIVSCACVCRRWRDAAVAVVRPLAESGKITFPSSLKQVRTGAAFCAELSQSRPGPRELPMQCFIKRNKKNSTFLLYLGFTNYLLILLFPPSDMLNDYYVLSVLAAPMDKGKFLMAARRFRRGPHTEYIISLDAEDLSQGSNAYMGKLR
nr:unnamed protein product [Digitaria exilis]